MALGLWSIWETAVFPINSVTLLILIILQRASAEALVQHLPRLLHGGPDPAPQDTGPQGTRAHMLRRHPLCCLQAEGWRGGSPGWEWKVSVSLCLCMAISKVWLLDESHVSSLGFSFSLCSGWARCHLTTPFSYGARGAPLGAYLLSLFSLCCHLPSHLGARGTGRGHVAHVWYRAERSQLITDVVACRWEARSRWLHLGTLPATHLACPSSPRSPNSPCDLSALFATATSRPPASLWST